MTTPNPRRQLSIPWQRQLSVTLCDAIANAEPPDNLMSHLESTDDTAGDRTVYQTNGQRFPPKKDRESAPATTTEASLWVTAWLSGSALVSINEVTLRRARLVLGVSDRLRAGKSPRFVTSHSGQLSLLPSADGK